MLAGSYAAHPSCDPAMLAIGSTCALVVAGGIAHALPADEVVVEDVAVDEPEDVLNRLWIVTAPDGHDMLG